MIIDDDPGAAQLMAVALRKYGHAPTVFGHAGLALGTIVRGKYELLIADLMLPNISGLDAIRMVRSQFPYMPVIVVSGMDANEWRPRSLEAGATCYLEKPVSLERFLAEVDLVEKSQVGLTIGIIDADRWHREQTDRALSSLGCEVHAWESIAGMLETETETSALSVLLVDGASSEAADAFRWANQRGVAAVAFEEQMHDLDQDKLMRLGASFCLAKPVDAEALVTQARFFVAPVPVRVATPAPLTRDA